MKKIGLILIILSFAISLFASSNPTLEKRDTIKSKIPNPNDNSMALASTIDEICNKYRSEIENSQIKGEELSITEGEIVKIGDTEVSFSLTAENNRLSEKEVESTHVFDGILTMTYSDIYKYNEVPFHMTLLINAEIGEANRVSAKSFKVENAYFGNYPIGIRNIEINLF